MIDPIEFTRDYQLSYTVDKPEFGYKINPEDYYWISFYNRRKELSTGSGVYHDEITKLYQLEVNRLNAETSK